MMKTVLITGAARGIGVATAEIFAENHYNTVLLDRDAPALAGAGERLPDALRLPIDIANPRPAGRWRPRSKGISGAWIVW
ncbi:MAG: SDR family NAD(P)-dependent oxidoreductase [Pseudomonadota bacterium]|nr:SDR family NAD(P)-dependent oxidoreductase [Pseudomonadota bacterium]